MKGSILAGEIDQDYKYKMNEYKRRRCKKCANRTTQLCHIVINVNGVANCVYYEDEEEK